MNENETNPQPADAGAEQFSTERVESEQPTAAQPPAAPQNAAHPSAAPQYPQQPPAPQHPQQPQHPQPPHNPWAQPVPGGYQQPAPQPPHPPQSPWQQPVSAAPTSGYPQYGQHPGYGQQPGWQHTTNPEGVVPVWAQPVDQPPRNPGRGRKFVLAGAAAVLIALLSGGVGAATALAVHDDNAPATVKSGNTSVSRVVDRSSLAQIASAVQDSVVSITTQSGEGSGVILSADGYIVTNNHVVATATGDTVNIIFADGKKTTATIVGTDPRTDLAVVKATGVSNLKAATFGDSSQMQVGDTVLALGSPLGLEGSVTAGIISAKDRTIQSSSEQDQQGQGQNPFGQSQQQQGGSGSTTMTGLLQTDAPINPGNSGGALVNVNGEVIGINSAIATSGSGSGNIGLGFAIPSDKAKTVAESLMSGKKVSHPALGVSVTTGENGGALVSQVVSKSAADKAGLQKGDVITKVDGKDISESDDLVAAVQSGTVGQQMTITFTRNGAEKQVTVTLAESQ
ncbi:trypsin [Actinoplanes sp. SE50]|uniref:S1C family serine protease n=1 Tax=unclassified Actinoplanes TaxID=2626549 RepID=UPI00023EE05C|nr:MULTISPECIES: trypsin-like peptidase domain-containing protein [unclassified Actinoplanes]AEV88419.1 PepD-like putative serine protease [Actinoplanes sp. SE50/110]ATO86824.1 trypsin [Actinoplanes sp. SE50]SLM04242.1 trypsin [Actinoplanes sp. SE50/110]